MKIEWSNGALQDLVRLQAEDGVDIIKLQKKVDRRLQVRYWLHKIFKLEWPVKRIGE